MNIYVILEGKNAAKKIYKSWIPIVNSNLQHIDYLENLEQNNFYVFAGLGQSEFMGNRIELAIKDVNKYSFDRLVIAIDSEESSFDEKKLEVKERVEQFKCEADVRYIIQHFCMETWFLGNKHTFRKNTKDIKLLNYLSLFDVRNRDPELLPSNIAESWNRAKFAYFYLQAGLRDVHSGTIIYSKKNPGAVDKKAYFNKVKKRCLDDRHILSFQGFLDAFQ